MLNALSASEEVYIGKQRVTALAKAAHISPRLELPTILRELEYQRLIDQSDSEVAILGLTTSETLKHTATIFEEAEPDQNERAAIHISEDASELPIKSEDALEMLSDTYEIAKDTTGDLLTQFNEIGFVDSENIGKDRIFFNGNLFRKQDIYKVNGVLSSLSTNEEVKVNELMQVLHGKGCISVEVAKGLAGEELLRKLISIGFTDMNTVINESGRYSFITHPSAFTKYTNSSIDDAFDLAKAFVTSLTYGVTRSPSSRGRIKMLEALMKRLTAGGWVGPATAIGQDYKVLEMRGVIEVKPSEHGRYYMRLLKRDVGEIALKVITEGEASTEAILQVPPSVAAKGYAGPEDNRVVLRKNQVQPLKNSIAYL